MFRCEVSDNSGEIWLVDKKEKATDTYTNVQREGERYTQQQGYSSSGGLRINFRLIEEKKTISIGFGRQEKLTYITQVEKTFR